MTPSRGRTTRGSVGALPVDCPQVVDIIRGLEAPRGEILAELRRRALALPEAAERAMYDAFCREWTPAYHLGPRQLFHVHNFHAGLRATVFVGTRTLEPLLLDTEAVPEALRLLVARAKGGRGTKMVKVPLDSLDDVPGFMELVRVKWQFLNAGPPVPPGAAAPASTGPGGR
jgi:hypothetical protein